ncbi:IS3 family transposase [Verrucomicrobia bacterium]|nr:IS3 family transposase [Verrucomicrobiota bacterium]
MKPTDRREAIGSLIDERGLSVRRACKSMSIARSTWYRKPSKESSKDDEVIEKLNEVAGKFGRWEFWKCFHWMRLQDLGWNHKRVLRIYREMGLNLPRRTKKRLPARVKQPLDAPARVNRMWSMDFMHDTLYHGQRFRVRNLFYEGVREATRIEVDTSLPAERVVRVLEQTKESRPFPKQIRVDSGPELISQKLVDWCDENDVHLHHIQPGKPTQNAYIERFNDTFRREVLDAHLFGSLNQVRQISEEWMIGYNEERPHESLGNIPPTLFKEQLTHNQTNQDSSYEVSS